MRADLHRPWDLPVQPDEQVQKRVLRFRSDVAAVDVVAAKEAVGVEAVVGVVRAVRGCSDAEPSAAKDVSVAAANPAVGDVIPAPDVHVEALDRPDRRRAITMSEWRPRRAVMDGAAAGLARRQRRRVLRAAGAPLFACDELD